ncbi:transcriptional regulator SUPERMAN [Ziziphus jujuba]|uniref:Transcriptional regulator SUPERMAN n=2 Tax=Ziziphus jujuba TaxID=326968 RepID=A0A6P3Z947_ZIZJJ|nr:transcriptional regulator SUPERMAN [Ziziphus jujuba]KAH7542405.1 hypothetical protein FEM48_Zijuj02G0069900 [Ziziphus jujuba var. spinosa]
MELEQPKPENSEDHDHQQQTDDATATQSVVAARSYECTFCKRGFSNAQALGGHMNIHRKDKAKLRQVNSPNFDEHHLHHQRQRQQQEAALDIPRMPPFYSSIPVMSSSFETKPADRLPRQPWFLDHNNNEGDTQTSKANDGEVVHQLRLFAETPPDFNKYQNPDHCPPPPHHHHDQVVDVKIEKGLSSSPSAGSELDLELRLGPEPHEDAPAAVGTRKFFY